MNHKSLCNEEPSTKPGYKIHHLQYGAMVLVVFHCDNRDEAFAAPKQEPG